MSPHTQPVKVSRLRGDVGGAQTSGTVSIGLQAQVFPAAVAGAAIGRADAKELRNRALPARLMVYFVIAMWPWSTSGYVRVLPVARWAALGRGQR